VSSTYEDLKEERAKVITDKIRGRLPVEEINIERLKVRPSSAGRTPGMRRAGVGDWGKGIEFRYFT
jgi:hypothetical protein